MLPILLCSVVVGAICLERWWTLRREEIIPAELLSQLQSSQTWSSDSKALAELAVASPLGYVIAAGLNGIDLQTEAFQRVMQSTIDNVAHELERYLTLVGIIASITPLMGILGTVFGMIDVFSTLVSAGQGAAKVLAVPDTQKATAGGRLEASKHEAGGEAALMHTRSGPSAITCTPCTRVFF